MRVPSDNPSDRGRNGITLILVCYNHRRFVTQALDSIAAQSRRPTQLIVTDDGSIDGTQELVKQWLTANWPDAVFLRNRENRGLPSTLNCAMEQVSGDFVALLAADDWMRVDRIELQASALEDAGPEVGMVWSRMLEVDESGQATGKIRPIGLPPNQALDGDLYLSLLGPSFMTTPSVMMRTTAKQLVGPYDERLVAEDYDMWLRMSKAFRWAFVDEPLIYYRIVPGSLSQSQRFRERWGEDRLLILRKNLGGSSAANRIVTAKMYRIALQLYKDGRSPGRTAVDVLFIARWRPSIRLIPILVASGIGLPGPLAARVSTRIRRLCERVNRRQTRTS